MNLTSKSPGLAMTPQVSRATKISRVRQYGVTGDLVSNVQRAANEIVGFRTTKFPKQSLVGNMDYLDQEVR